MRWLRRLLTRRRVLRTFDFLWIPMGAFFVLGDRGIDPSHGMTWRRKLRLVWRLYRITRSLQTGTSYRALVAMASKVLRFPPDQEGVLVECGSWLGGSAAGLSVICEYADRRLVVYDSFEGLPEADPADAMAVPEAEGLFRGSLETVRENVKEHGAIDRCIFRKGWFENTLPHHTEPILLVYLDVDYQKSLHECVLHLWPHLVETGYVFIDEFIELDYCALFWSERWWKDRFDRHPPGIHGSGSGIGLGHFWVGPADGDFGTSRSRPYQQAASVAYTRKDFSGRWGFHPEE